MENKLRIKIVNLKKKFKNETAEACVLNEIDFEFEQGIGYAIQGISGVGKTTLIHIISGLDVPSFGSVFYNEVALHDQDSNKLISDVIGLIFQESYLLHELTVLENVMIKGFIDKEIKNDSWARELLEMMQLKDAANKYPHQLSGGEQQRVSIARALFHMPKIIIADEPTAHLDKENKKIVLDLLLHFKNNYNMGLIISTHDPLVAEAMDVKLKIKNGKLIKAE